MTNEEAREQIDNLRAHCSDMARSTFTGGEVLWAKDVEALAQTIKALEQEPCEDCISRQAVMNALCDGCELFKNGEQTCRSKCEEYHFLATLPPVTPQPKTGHWIRFKEFENGYYHIKCSECGQYWSIDGHAKIFRYCFNCGAKMEEVEEE
jgi:ribosomal protein S27E